MSKRSGSPSAKRHPRSWARHPRTTGAALRHRPPLPQRTPRRWQHNSGQPPTPLHLRQVAGWCRHVAPVWPNYYLILLSELPISSDPADLLPLPWSSTLRWLMVWLVPTIVAPIHLSSSRANCFPAGERENRLGESLQPLSPGWAKYRARCGISAQVAMWAARSAGSYLWARFGPSDKNSFSIFQNSFNSIQIFSELPKFV
jgi:hypothetical protein